jgi:carboxypeptidase T
LPDNQAALLYAFKAARRPYQAPAGPDALNVSVAPSLVEPGAVVEVAALVDDTRHASAGSSTQPAQNIAGARYTIDLPSWAPGAVSVPMWADGGSFDAPQASVHASIDTIGWPPGRYLIFVEGQDADGNWGVPSAVFLNVAQEVTHHYFPTVFHP